MDTSRFTTPITDHLPSHLPSHLPTTGASAMMSHLTDATTGLADQIGDQAGHFAEHVGDIDVAGTIRRGRRFVAGIVPGMSTRPRFTSRHWVIAAVAVAAVIAVFVTVRRRSTHDSTPAPRDDWATSPSSNGVSANPAPAEREDATTGV